MDRLEIVGLIPLIQQDRCVQRFISIHYVAQRKKCRWIVRSRKLVRPLDLKIGFLWVSWRLYPGILVASTQQAHTWVSFPRFRRIASHFWFSQLLASSNLMKWLNLIERRGKKVMHRCPVLMFCQRFWVNLRNQPFWLFPMLIQYKDEFMIFHDCHDVGFLHKLLAKATVVGTVFVDLGRFGVVFEGVSSLAPCATSTILHAHNMVCRSACT